MTAEAPPKSRTPRFSMLNLLAITTAAAVAMAVATAYQKSQSLALRRDALLAMSSQLDVKDESKLSSSRFPMVSSQFDTWNVHVPAGRDYELRLGAGDISEHAVPPIVGSVPIPGGRHRVTLYSGDTTDEAFRYVVYLDGAQVIEKVMGVDWIPGGWSSARGMSWPREANREAEPLQLSGRGYRPRRDFGSNYFNGQNDEFVTSQGYRLWIDTADGAYQAASPVIGDNRTAPTGESVCGTGCGSDQTASSSTNGSSVGRASNRQTRC